LIAKEWFRHVNRIKKICLLNESKECMNGKTFVGEDCGNQQYQHLVKDTEVDIYFVAIVENNNDVTCLPPSEAFPIFEKFGLTHVKYYDMGAYDNWQAFNESLKQIYIDVSQATSDSEDVGSVIY
jgi:ATP-dependent RNA circularization protein (DNA/RNA ligase family)